MNMDILFEVLGISLLIIGLINLARIYSRSKWSHVTGKILISRISRSQDDVDIARLTPLPGYGLAKKLTVASAFTPNLVYQYTADSVDYLGGPYYSAPLWFLNISKLRFVTEGADHSVYYKPNKPEKCYLFKSSVMPSICLVMLGLCVFQYQYILTELSALFS